MALFVQAAGYIESSTARRVELIAGIEIIGEAAADHRHVGMVVEQEGSTR